LAVNIKLVAIVLHSRIFSPEPRTSIHLELSTVDGEHFRSVCVAVALTASAADLRTALETAITTYCGTIGITIASKELLIVGEPAWRVV